MERINMRALPLILALLMIFILIDYVSGQTETNQEQTKLTEIEVEVTVKSVNLIYNDHVGNDWTTYSEVNDVPISRYQKFEKTYCSPEVTLKLYAFAKEYDKYPDIGSNSCAVNLRLKDGNENTEFVTLDVRVVENRGRYAGNSALWRFSYKITIKPEEPSKKIYSSNFYCFYIKYKEKKESLTDIQFKEWEESLIEKKVKWQGEIGEVESVEEVDTSEGKSLYRALIDLGPGGGYLDKYDVIAYFSGEEKYKALAFKKDQKVEFIGIIENIIVYTDETITVEIKDVEFVQF